MNKDQLENLHLFLNRSEKIIGSRKEFLDYLGLTEKAFSKYQESLKELPVSSLILISQELNLRYQDILNGKIDYVSLHEHLNNDKLYLKDEYTNHAKSRVKTMKNIFEYLNPFFQRELIAVLDELQVNEKVFKDPSRKISVKLIDDVFRLLNKYSISKEIAFQTGLNGADLLKEYSPFFSEFSTCKKIQDVYELCFDNKIRAIDGTWNYQIQNLTENECIIKVTTQQEARDFFKTSSFGSENFKYYRAGITNGIASYLNGYLSQTVIEDFEDNDGPFSLFKTKFYKKSEGIIQH